MSNYLSEWQESCVDEGLIHLNVLPLAGNSPSEYLLYSDTLPRRNDGRLSQTVLKRYEHTVDGGWWCSGIDLLTGENDLWGCFKPNHPRLSCERGKPIKYEHPPKTATGIFALRVPTHLWQRIAQRWQVDMPTLEANKGSENKGFWQWLIETPEVPLLITEGAKKAGTLLTAGYAAIALPGIHNGYRTPKDSQGKRIGKSHLIPQLEKLANSGREIAIVFDQDSKLSTVKTVNGAVRRMGYLLSEAGCSVKVVSWDGQLGKGVDDLIAQQGEKIFHDAYERAVSLDIWKAKELTQLTYPANQKLNCRYLPPLSLAPTAQVIGIKSAKGTGKTQALEQVVRETLTQQKPVIVIGHRVKLVEELCQRFGLPYIAEWQQNPSLPFNGYGLCIDSLHGASQAKFNPVEWSGATVIIDEAEQVIWHTLNSETCRNHRVAILSSLKRLMQTVLGNGGRVFLADADLSNISLDYVISLSGFPLEPFIINNDWKPDEKAAYSVFRYNQNTPKILIKNLIAHIHQGGKPFISLSAQKLASRWGTQTIEAYLKIQFPQKNILRIDSESLADPDHPAYRCVNQLDEVLRNYDIVLASPAIETGVSIDLKDHFTSVWCIAQGVQSATSVCQALGRVRQNIPRHLWSAVYGFNQVGNGSTSIPALLTSGHRLTELNIRLLQQSDFAAIDDLDTGFQAESLLCWAKMAVRINAAMIHYRESILAFLEAEGQIITDAASVQSTEPTSLNATKSGGINPEANPESRQTVASDSKHNQLSEMINAVKAQNYQQECEAIAAAEILSETDYQGLKKQLVKSLSQRHALRRYEITRRYGLAVTTELVALDDQGWYSKLRLHYFLTVGRPYLAERDGLAARQLMNWGNGKLFLPDFNGSQLGAMIGAMDVLGLPVLLANPQRKLQGKDQDLQRLLQLALDNRVEIKTILKIGIAQNATPITIIRRLVEKIGCTLSCVGSKRIDKKSIRLYQLVIPNDNREEVFNNWLAQDKTQPGSSESGLDIGISLSAKPLPSTQKADSEQVQLSLNV